MLGLSKSQGLFRNDFTEFIPLIPYLFDTVLKVIKQPTFVSRCIPGTYFLFYGLVIDIDRNCGSFLYLLLMKKKHYI